MKKQNEQSAELREEELEQVAGGANKKDAKKLAGLSALYLATVVGAVAGPMEAPVQSAQNEDDIAELDPFSVR